MRVGVPVEQHARVEHKVGVEDALEVPHEVVRLGAPLHLHERCHVPARAVLPCTTKHNALSTHLCQVCAPVHA